MVVRSEIVNVTVEEEIVAGAVLWRSAEGVGIGTVEGGFFPGGETETTAVERIEL
jgi:hypothetical protein